MTHEPAFRHPEPEELATFAEGNISATDLPAIKEHLAACADCVETLGATVRFLDEESRREPRQARSYRSRRRWPWLVAAAITAVLSGALWQARPSKPLVDRLVAAAPSDVRFIEPRVSGGFPWAPLADQQRNDARDPRQMELIGAAGRVLRDANPQGSLGDRRAIALAHMVSGNAEEAIATLARIPEADRDASVWNDLACAYYTVARASDAPEQLQAALVAVDRALAMKPDLAEALFNRALILERFHLRDAAITAWQKYLAVESGSAWTAEAQQHLQRLVRRSTVSVETVYASLVRDEPNAANAVAALDRGELRYFAETEGLGRWAAGLPRDTVSAERELQVLRHIAGVLQSSGEFLLTDTIAAIDRAPDVDRTTLARGHLAFRDGRRLYKQRRPSEAEKLLAQATKDLQSANSPMADLARVFLGVAIFGQNRHGESAAIFDSLAASVPPRYVALRSYVLWQQASCLMARANYGESITLLSSAIRQYERLREVGNTAYLHDILSQVLDIVGDSKTANAHRMFALRVLGQEPSYRLEHAIGGMVYQAAQRKDWSAVLSYLTLEVDIAREVGDKELQTNLFLRRALVRGRLNHHSDARSDLQTAANIVAGVTDVALHEKMTNDLRAAEALITSDPPAAVELLTSALEFHQSKGWLALIPDLYLRRGIMQRRMGQREEALRDFVAGIEELEHHRKSLPAGEARLGILDAGDELFEHAIDTSLRNNLNGAFALAERSRARGLSDPNAKLDLTQLPSDTLLIEYVVLEERLLLFFLSRDGLRYQVRNVGRKKLESVVRDFATAIRTSDQRSRQRAGRMLSDLLIGPAADFKRHSEVVFVPDGPLWGVPFAALELTKPLIDTHRTAVASSARHYLDQRRRQGSRSRATLLLVDSPASTTLSPLRIAADEASSIEGLYPTVRRFSGRDATAQAFLREASSANVIHFAGHTAQVTLAFAPTQQNTGAVDAATIARLGLDHVSIVVLATCESAQGPLSPIEGPRSIAYAFTQAGVPAVVATLWPISDRDAARFFPRLHHYLAQGVPANLALQRAQKEFISDPANQTSTLWAAVQLLGY